MLFTNSIKQFYYNQGKSAPPNLIALLNALVVGGGEGIFIYILLGISFTFSNILWLIFLVFLIWNGSMQGWDKLIQTYEQYKKWKAQMAAVLPKVDTELDPSKDEPAAAPDLKNNKN